MFFLLAPLATAGALAAGCAQPSTAERHDPVTLRIGTAIPKAPGGGAVSFAATYLTSEPFLGIGWDGRPFPKLASAWSWSEDGRTLTLQLHKNLRFHDGTPVEIEHAKIALELSVKSLKAQLISFKNVTAVQIDPNTPGSLQIRLSRPDAFLLTDLANVPLPHPKNDAIGLGPFRTLTTSPTMRLEAFADYYRGRPSLDFVEVQEFDDPRTSWAALMRDQIDAVHEIAPSAMDFIKAEGQTIVRTFPFTRPYFISLIFNVKHPVFKNPMVRQALSYAADREAIIDLAMNGQGRVAEGPIWPFHWAYSTSSKNYTRNIEAATLRLDSAGLRLKPGAPGRMPSRLRFRCLTLAKDARYEKIALVLQKQLFEIGVDMEIEAIARPELVKRIPTGQYDAVLVERTSGRALAWTYYFFHSSLMSGGYSAADGELDRLRNATGDGDVRKAVSDLQQKLYDDPPAIFIAWPQVARVVSAKFAVPSPDDTGRDTTATPDVMSSLRLWTRLDGAR